jgi:DNA-binding XRE family transcriptional regulator
LLKLERADARTADEVRSQAAPALPEELFLARVGVAVRVLRITKRMTQRRLADLAGVTLSTVNRLEQGTTAGHIITITAIERGLGVKPGWLIRLAS